MHTNKLFLFVGFTVLVASFAFAQSHQHRETNNSADWLSQAADTDSVVLQLDSDPNYGRMIESQTLIALLKSGALIDPAIEKALGTSAAEGRKHVNIDGNIAGNRFVQLNVAIKADLPNAKPGLAKALTTALTDRLRAAVQQSAQAANAGMDARRTSLEADLAAARERLASAQKALAAARVSPTNNGMGNPRYNYDNLIQQKQQIDVQLAGMRARAAVLSEQQPTTQPAEQSARVTTINAFQKLIELRQQRFDALKEAKATDAQIADAELALAEARAFSDAFASIGNRNGLPNYYNNGINEMPQLRAGIAENQARLASINAQLAAMGPPTTNPSVTPPEDANYLQSTASRARNEVDNLENQLADLRRNNRSGAPPTLTVLDGASAGTASDNH